MRGQEDRFLAPLCYAPLGVSASRRLPVYYLPMARDLAPLVDTLAEIVGPRHVRTALPERVTYAKDGLPTHRRVPGVVVLPGNRDEVIAIVRLLGALGSPGGEPWGPDLVGLFVGSEGNFGVATRITVRLLPVARAVRTLLADFTSLRTAGEAVSAVIASGIVPAALEMMDQSCIRAVE